MLIIVLLCMMFQDFATYHLMISCLWLMWIEICQTLVALLMASSGLVFSSEFFFLFETHTTCAINSLLFLLQFRPFSCSPYFEASASVESSATRNSIDSDHISDSPQQSFQVSVHLLLLTFCLFCLLTSILFFYMFCFSSPWLPCASYIFIHFCVVDLTKHSRFN